MDKTAFPTDRSESLGWDPSDPVEVHRHIRNKDTPVVCTSLQEETVNSWLSQQRN